jgi:hypothetical protein
MATVNRLPLSAVEALWPAAAPDAPAPSVARLPKLSTGRSITIAIDESNIRIVAFAGRRVVDWGTIDLGEGALELPVSFKRYTGRFARKITDLPFYAPLVRFIDKPGVQSRYVTPVIEASVATSIPFEPSEVDIAWRDLDEGRGPEVMVTATPKREIDAHVDLMNIIGITPSALYSKSAALAMAAGIPNAIVTHLGAISADLVLVRDDIPRSVHRVALPQRDDPEAFAAVLTQAVDELAGYDHERVNDSSVGEVPWIVLTGSVPDAGPLHRALQTALGGRLRLPSPQVWYPDGFPAAEYASNLGLAVADWSAHPRRWLRDDEALAPSIDLLPERHRSRVFPKTAVRMAIISAGAALLVSTALFGAGQARATTADLQTEITRLESQARLDAIQASRFNRDQTVVASINRQLEGLTALESSQQADVTDVITRLGLLTIDSPVRRVNAVSVDQVRGLLRVTANATSINQALAFTDAMRASGLYEQVDVKDVAVGATASGSQPGAGDLTVNIEATYPFAAGSEQP